jgi:predicted ATP-binding protein involved in virulence
LKEFDIEDVPDMVVLAGPNGVGKSSVLQAIAYLKEVIAPYPPYGLPPIVSRWQSKVVSTSEDFAEITCIFEIAPAEVDYLRLLGQTNIQNDYEVHVKLNKNGQAIEKNVSDELGILLKTYDRENNSNIGIFDYLDAHRIFPSHPIDTISISQPGDHSEITQRYAAGQEKFNTLKNYLVQLKLSELQAIHEKLARNIALSSDDVFPSLKQIQELFNRLIPSKELVDVDIGVAPVKFIIKGPTGTIDIDDLSSGEKEILFVFTALYRLRLRNSVILFDEPDLHLNEEVQRKIPSLLQGLGKNNQIWIATHSVSIMDTVQPSQLFRVKDYSGGNQVTRVFDDASKIEAFRAVVGSLGIVTLGEKIVFLEGIERTDKSILESWFPHYRGKIAFVSSLSLGNIKMISEKILSLIQSSSKFTYFYSVRDRDFLTDNKLKQIQQIAQGKIYVWSKYHIENFLIDEEIIFTVFEKIMPKDNPFLNSQDCLDKLRQTVTESKTFFVNSMIEYECNLLLKERYLKISATDEKESILQKVQGIEANLDSSQVLRIIQKDLFDKSMIDNTWKDILFGRYLSY